MTPIHDDVVTVFRRAKGTCECTRSNHDHVRRCTNPVLWRSRGLRTPLGLLFGVWQIHYVISRARGGKNCVKNMEILCSTCDHTTRSRTLKFKCEQTFT